MTPGCLKAVLSWAVAAFIISLSGSKSWDKIASIALIVTKYSLIDKESERGDRNQKHNELRFRIYFSVSR